MKKGVFKNRLNQLAAFLGCMMIFVLGASIAFGDSVKASVPMMITYQGRVFGQEQLPLSGENVNMSFSLFDAEEGGNCLWTYMGACDPDEDPVVEDIDEVPVTLFNSRFLVNLGEEEPLSADLFSENSELYLEVSVGGEVLTPRRKLTASPYAMHADNASKLEGLTRSDFFRTGNVVFDIALNEEEEIDFDGSSFALYDPNIIDGLTLSFLRNSYIYGLDDPQGDELFDAQFRIIDASGWNYDVDTPTFADWGASFMSANTLFSVALDRSFFGSPVEIDASNFAGGSTLLRLISDEPVGGGLRIEADHMNNPLFITQSDANNASGVSGGSLARLARTIDDPASCPNLGDCNSHVLDLSYNTASNVGSRGSVLRISHNAPNGRGPTLNINSNSDGQVIRAVHESSQIDGGNTSRAAFDFSSIDPNYTGRFMSLEYAGSGIGLNFAGRGDVYLEDNAFGSSTVGDIDFSNVETTLSDGVSVVSTSLADAINASDTVFTVTDASDFNDDDIIQIGDERMKITNVNGDDFTVERGDGGTTAQDHGNGALVTRITVELQVADASGFSENDIIQIGSEKMEVIGVIVNQLTVERGYEGTDISTHGNGDSVYLIEDDYEFEVVDASGFTVGNEVVVTDGASISEKMEIVDISPSIETQLNGDIDNEVTSFTVDDAGGFSVNDIIQIGDERMEITNVNGNEFTVERGHSNTNIQAHNNNDVITKINGRTITVKRAIDGSLLRSFDSESEIYIDFGYLQNEFINAGGGPPNNSSELFMNINAARDNFLMRIENSSLNSERARGLFIRACGYISQPGCELARFEGAGGTASIAVNNSGEISFTGAGADYAELFPGDLSLVEKGDVIGLRDDGTVGRANNSMEIIGAYSTNPIVLGNAFNGWRQTGQYIPVGLMGQIDVKVNVEGGEIKVGDYLTISSVPGVAMKANHPGMTLGRALADHDEGTGVISVYVHSAWHAGSSFAVKGDESIFAKNFILEKEESADADSMAISSPVFSLVSSFWNGNESIRNSFNLRNQSVDENDYNLVFSDNDDETVMALNNSGNLFLRGSLYPGDRGEKQSERYIFYDSSTGIDGFMRTNADGWGTGSYDFAEMFPATSELVPGELVVFSPGNSETVMRSPAEAYNRGLAGIVSTRPGFLAGENKPGHYPIALVGRVPTKVTNENGAIKIGDPLTTSATRPGYAMKATESGTVVGFALENSNLATDNIIVFVRAGYHNVNELVEMAELNTENVLNVAGQSLTNVDSIFGLNNKWNIDAVGNLTIAGRFRQILRSYSGLELETYAVVSPQPTIQFAGTVSMVDGRADIRFDHLDSKIKNLIGANNYQVFLTPNRPTGSLYVSTRDERGFTVREVDGKSNAILDWLVIAYPYGFEKEGAFMPGMEIKDEEEDDEDDEDYMDEEGSESENNDEDGLDDESEDLDGDDEDLVEDDEGDSDKGSDESADDSGIGEGEDSGQDSNDDEGGEDSSSSDSSDESDMSSEDAIEDEETVEDDEEEDVDESTEEEVIEEGQDEDGDIGSDEDGEED